MALNIGILLFDEVEVLDFCGPFEVLSMTGYNHPTTMNKVMLIGEKEIITARGGMRVQVDHVIENTLPQLDILLVPGGFGTTDVIKNDIILKWLKDLRPSLKYILSVCSGVSILGKCGFLDGLVVTTHHLCYETVKESCPNSRICTCRRFIDNDPIFSSAGVSAGIDLSLYFVKKIFGLEVAELTTKHMEYNWTDPDVCPSACICAAETSLNKLLLA